MGKIKLDTNSEQNILNMLLEGSSLSSDQMSKINATSPEIGKSKLETAIELNFTDEKKIQKVLASSYSLDLISLDKKVIDPKIKRVIDIRYIQDNFLVPFEMSGGVLKIAIADASKLGLMKNLKTMTKMEPELYAATLTDVNDFIDRMSRQDVKKISSSNVKVEKIEKNKDELIEVGSEVISFGNNLITEAINLGVSDIHIECYRDSAQVRFRIDGILKIMDKYSKFLFENYNAVVARIKIISKLDIAERRVPQDGASTFKSDTKEIDLRISILPTKNNERIVMRILNKDAGDISLEQLNFEENDLKNLRKAIHGTQGLILVTGPTGSGKTTTLYSILKEVSKPHLNILTAEDPVEYELDGVGQVQIKDDIGYDFNRALRSFLRQDPEIILVGEMRDKETVDIGLKAALTGHLVFSTLHTNDAPSSITRLQNMGTPDYLISAACSLVLAQRLARKTCTECREPDPDVTPKVLEEIGFTAEQASRAKAFKGKGCPKCKDSGYKGRMGIYEVLNVTKPVKEAILRKATTPELKEIAKKEGFRTMADMGREMIISGDLNFREFDRVLSMD